MALVNGAYLLFGRMARHSVANNPDLSVRLLKSRLPLHPEAFLSLTYLGIASAALLGVVAGMGAAALGGSILGVSGWWFAPLMGLLMGVLTYLFFMTWVEIRVEARASRIDASMPYALNFISSLSSAGVIPHEAFGALARQRVYGAVADEARMIHRDVALLGKDIVSALMEASRRSASVQFSEFLQGTVSVVVSGGNLQDYFFQRAQKAAEIRRRGERSYLESLGLMSESYVVTAAAGPLFLLVIVTVMSLMMSRGVNPLTMIYAIIFGLLPIIHASFALILRVLRPAA